MANARPFALAFVLAGCMLCSNVAFAAGGAEIFKLIVQVLGGFCLASAAIQAITGFIAYSEAKSDADGPAMAKAENKIKSAVLIGILGAALSLGSTTLASFINDSIKF